MFMWLVWSDCPDLSGRRRSLRFGSEFAWPCESLNRATRGDCQGPIDRYGPLGLISFLNLR